ncbi:Zinc finger, C2H2 type family protein [Trichomonas vaginalis G3]|uniref:Zinc finger, C2H2 type family protein n=1 Tax=Trichomonas vaginalis (strain ATCC PRA-98 / G3) TaxID=412133 RepID=A2G025_TRIV3|nr:C2HC-type zinc finger-containing protein [Trichomonas vaginalis G3]EAX89497.1 Zinc finger, C2H2 type family protein [Trichomonas vaginalis G3]KAI5543270.1 C2HC-type zinc finger-containing protein [Trichomonas vaginalis G3]|eukprot:XP_001302427.1 Zinc finger, C2H2 type family protein [Trichomonas vaginalis G3]
MKPSLWTPAEVACEVRQNGFDKFSRDFMQSGITGKDLYFVTDADLKKIGMTITQRSKFMTWVKSLPPYRVKSNPGGNKLHKCLEPRPDFDLPKTPASPKQSSQRTTTTFRTTDTRSSGTRASASRRVTPYNTNVSSYSSKVHTFAPPSDDFDIHELDFTPPPRVTTIPKPIRAMRGKGPKLNISEDGSTSDRQPCHYCGRKFAPDRLPVHERICAKTRKRRPFNASMHRVSGTEMRYVPRSSRAESKSNSRKYINGKPKYKIEHENLVAALRAARGMAAYESGKIKAMPKMPKMQDVPDGRVKCPVCGRKFGPEQAERHIPFCKRNAGIRPPARPVKRRY